MRAVVIKFRFAVGSLACIIFGASDFHCIVNMGASWLLGILIPHFWVLRSFDGHGKAFNEVASFGCLCRCCRCRLQLFGERFKMCIGAQIWNLAVLWE
jgi:hypothetical protein